MSLGTLYHLLLYLEEDISMIQDHLGIVSHSDQKISGLEEANKMQERIFKTSDGSLPLVPLAENGPGVLIQKFIYRKWKCFILLKSNYHYFNCVKNSASARI